MKKSNNRPVEAMRITATLDVTIMIKTINMKVITWINYEAIHKLMKKSFTLYY